MTTGSGRPLFDPFAEEHERHAADAVEAVDEILWPIPPTAEPGGYRVTMQVVASDGETLSANHADITVR